MTSRERALARWSALKIERSSWINRYREVSSYLLPFSGRYFTQDRNRGDKVFNDILDSTATRALDILSAGMMAGMTSPARPWFRLATPDPELMEVEGVKLWLNDVGQLMRDIFARSNTYRALHSLYEELGSFCTAANIIDENFDHVIWNSTLTAGEYAIACDQYGRVNTLYREFEMTVAQMVEKFAPKNAKSGTPDLSVFSTTVQNLWTGRKAYDTWRPVLHLIEPRAFKDREYGSKLAKDMPFASCYYEQNDNNENKVLRESGYKLFPVLGPRWHTRGGDVYGHGPGMKALGDIKQLQHEQLRKAQGIDYMVRPPIAVPAELKSRDVSTLPGGINYFPGGSTPSRGHNLFDVKIDLGHLLADIVDVRQRINQAFYADLFLMMSSDQRRQPVTAREIAERHEEKLLMLGPVLERLHDEMLSPLIDITFTRMVQSGILPDPPQEMNGVDLKVEFVSTLAQAQKAVGLGALDRLLGTVVLIAQGGRPDVMDKIDIDQVVDKYADMLAIDPSTIVADEKVAFIRADRAKQQAAMQQAATIPAAASAAKDLSQANTEEKSLLTDVMRQFSGYTT